MSAKAKGKARKLLKVRVRNSKRYGVTMRILEQPSREYVPVYKNEFAVGMCSSPQITEHYIFLRGKLFEHAPDTVYPRLSDRNATNTKPEILRRLAGFAKLMKWEFEAV